MGFFTIDRELLTHEIWLKEPFTYGQAWVDLIGLANHKDHKMFVRGKTIECRRGEVNRSYRWLSERWKWSVNKVRRFVKVLETEQMLIHETRQGETVLILCNYCSWQDKYRENGTHNGTVIDTQTEHRRNTNGTLTEHEQQYINNYNKGNNNQFNPNNKNRGAWSDDYEPKYDVVRDYIRERESRS